MPTFNDHLPTQHRLDPLLVPQDVFNDLLQVVNALKSQTNARADKKSSKRDRTTTVYDRTQALQKGKEIYGRAFYNWMISKSLRQQMETWSHIVYHGFRVDTSAGAPDPAKELDQGAVPSDTDADADQGTSTAHDDGEEGEPERDDSWDDYEDAVASNTDGSDNVPEREGTGTQTNTDVAEENDQSLSREPEPVEPAKGKVRRSASK